MTETIQQFLEACHPFGYPLLACSVIMLAAILYHLLFTGERRAYRRLRQKLDVAKMQNSAQVLLESALCSKSPLAREVIYCVEHRYEPDIEKIIEARLRLLIDGQRAGMSLISVITTIAPMLFERSLERRSARIAEFFTELLAYRNRL